MARPTKDDIIVNLGVALAAALDLMNNITEDIKEQRHVSDETIELIRRFDEKVQTLEGVLDAINGVN